MRSPAGAKVTVRASWSTSRPPITISRVGAERGTAVLVDLAGDQRCTQPGCGRTTGLACEYVDRRGHGCRRSWCPGHRLGIDGRVYCRRHVGVVSALPVGHVGHIAPMPDLETRAPSLVGWVAWEVDADIRQLLLAGLRDDQARLVTDPVYLVVIGCDRRRTWERAWKLVDHFGESLRIALVVEGCADAEVEVRVNAESVDRLTPPWTVQRLHGAMPPPEVDAQRRKDFNSRLLGVIHRGIERDGYKRLVVAGARDAAEAALPRP